MKTTLMALLGLVCFTFMAAAADLNGKYTAEVPGRQGATQTTTFTFKTTGDKVEGTVANMRGETPIADGKLSGDTLTFSMTMNMRGTEMKIAYTGKVTL